MQQVIATFSIVARDPETGELGVASQSKFLAVGSAVPWARSGVGAVATQAWANVSFGPRGLTLLAENKAAQQVLDELLASDPDREHRQVGIVDAQGNVAAWTGPQCLHWAGHHIGEGYVALGNILVSEDTIQSMATAFEQTRGHLADRLVASLDAGQRAGGDARGRQSAALYVVREGGGYSGFNDRLVDLRIDDHPEPIQELARLLELHRQTFLQPTPPERLQLAPDRIRFFQDILRGKGLLQGESTGTFDAATQAAFNAFAAQAGLQAAESADWVPGETALVLREEFFKTRAARE